VLQSFEQLIFTFFVFASIQSDQESGVVFVGINKGGVNMNFNNGNERKEPMKRNGG